MKIYNKPPALAKQGIVTEVIPSLTTRGSNTRSNQPAAPECITLVPIFGLFCNVWNNLFNFCFSEIDYCLIKKERGILQANQKTLLGTEVHVLTFNRIISSLFHFVSHGSHIIRIQQNFGESWISFFSLTYHYHKY